MALNVLSIDSMVQSVEEDVIAWRRHLHQHPEVSFQERETAQFVYDRLSTFPHLQLTRPTPTSVVARLSGARPGKTLALRADMDALPIYEENDVPYCSQKEGVMHACGHDGHTAMLLGAAKVLAERQADIAGDILFVFQHAEELLPGGAAELVEQGVLDGVDAVVGQHLWQPLETQRIGIRAGELMASPDTFYITILGRGGHAAQPHLNVDPIAIGAQVVTNLQHVASRLKDPLHPFVLSVTKFIGGTADNVIPGSVELCGTVRTFREELRDDAAAWMERIVRGITEAHGASYTFRYDKGYRPVINDEQLTAFVQDALVEAFGADMVTSTAPTMGERTFQRIKRLRLGSSSSRVFRTRKRA
ncbi:N-acyl-L-amino acid amidohydrolase [Alicyclobacillus fastidiosus]|nr:N-acyl-L-amino acid amidohydrolase [Alicyclobacillus fastidiosus]